MDGRVRVEIRSMGPEEGNGAVSGGSGSAVFEEGLQTVCYAETLEGLDAPARTRLRFRQGFLSLTREAEITSRMEFAAGSRTRCVYGSTWGDIVLETETESVAVRETAGGIHAMVRYRMEMAPGQWESRKVLIHVMPENSVEF